MRLCGELLSCCCRHLRLPACPDTASRVWGVAKSIMRHGPNQLHLVVQLSRTCWRLDNFCSPLASNAIVVVADMLTCNLARLGRAVFSVCVHPPQTLLASPCPLGRHQPSLIVQAIPQLQSTLQYTTETRGGNEISAPSHLQDIAAGGNNSLLWDQTAHLCWPAGKAELAG